MEIIGNYVYADTDSVFAKIENEFELEQLREKINTEIAAKMNIKPGILNLDVSAKNYIWFYTPRCLRKCYIALITTDFMFEQMPEAEFIERTFENHDYSFIGRYKIKATSFAWGNMNSKLCVFLKLFMFAILMGYDKQQMFMRILAEIKWFVKKEGISNFARRFRFHSQQNEVLKMK